MAELDMLQWSQLAAALANVSKRFARNNPSQAGFADAMLQSAQSNIINENAKKEKKKQEKKEKGIFGGDIGGILGTALGMTLAAPTGGMSMAAGGALGGALGSTGGNLATGGQFDPVSALSYGVTGAMAGKSAMPATPAGVVENGINMGSAVEPLKTAGTNAFGQARPSGLGPGFSVGPTLLGGGMAPIAQAPGFTANQAKTQLAPQPAPQKGHPFSGFFGNVGAAYKASRDPIGTITAQATEPGQIVNGYEVPYTSMRRGVIEPSATRNGVRVYRRMGGYY